MVSLGLEKTMIAKALANKTNSTFIGFVGSELVQKFIGEGTKLVREIFKIAKKKSPSIIFIDEIDSIAAKKNRRWFWWRERSSKNIYATFSRNRWI